MQRLDQALGREAEAISPLMPVAELSTERRFAEPIARQEDISQVIAALAAGIIEPLERRGLACAAAGSGCSRLMAMSAGSRCRRRGRCATRR